MTKPATEWPFCVWMGWLRVIAMLMVCLCHAGDPLAAFGSPGERIWSEIYGSFVRPCVPLFVMLTGALLLPTRESFGGIFAKRIRRVLLPFIVWSAVYAALPWLLHTCGLAEETIQRVCFPFAAPLHTDAASIGRTLFLSIFQFNQYAVPLWYIYLLIGLYLFMPILSAWLTTATTRAKVTFLALWAAALALWDWPLLLEALLNTSWGATLFSDYALRFLGAPTFDLAKTAAFDAYPLLGACDWNAYGLFHPFSGFVGYLVLGHLLKSVNWTPRRTLALALPLLLLGYAIVLGGTHWMWNRPDCSAKMFEFFWWYCSLPVAMMSAGAFLLIKCISWAPSPILHLLKSFTRCGFGVFCAHYVIVTGTYCCLRALLPTPLLLPTAATLGMALTWLLIHLLQRLSALRPFVG